MISSGMGELLGFLRCMPSTAEVNRRATGHLSSMDVGIGMFLWGERILFPICVLAES